MTYSIHIPLHILRSCSESTLEYSLIMSHFVCRPANLERDAELCEQSESIEGCWSVYAEHVRHDCLLTGPFYSTHVVAPHCSPVLCTSYLCCHRVIVHTHGLFGLRHPRCMLHWQGPGYKVDGAAGTAAPPVAASY